MFKLLVDCYFGSGRLFGNVFKLVVICLLMLVIYEDVSTVDSSAYPFLFLITAMVIVGIAMETVFTFRDMTEFKYPMLKLLFARKEETIIFIRDLIVNNEELSKSMKLNYLTNLNQYSYSRGYDLHSTQLQHLVDEYHSVKNNIEFSSEINKITQKEIELEIYNNLGGKDSKKQLTLQHTT